VLLGRGYLQLCVRLVPTLYAAERSGDAGSLVDVMHADTFFREGKKKLQVADLRTELLSVDSTGCERGGW
jgi:hypothetical protein